MKKTGMDINFNYYEGRLHYVVMAALRGGKIESLTVYLIRRNGSIVRRKTWEISDALSDGLRMRIENEVYGRAKRAIRESGVKN